ncbi:GIY-YIG nuclease family protein [Bacillus thuringiensis]|uniref:GIY-YIG nuclease family protein n=1 Tax=Bacillus thuringiensis TaxID=1428 RepID=UPI001EE0FC4A|nr:GIY-YIG nuclease family protein [Bacillus thuringiensis]MCG3425073.1 GIY-YIG nuclease family protein [Bacillus thuringiensis]
MINIKIPQNEFKIDLSEKDFENGLKKKQGIYMFHNAKGTLMYIGRSQDIKNRIKMHMSKTLRNPFKAYNHNFHYVSGFYVEDALEVVLYEIYAINKYKPKLNREHVILYETDWYNDKWKDQMYLELERQKEKEMQARMDKMMQDFNI